MQRIPITQSEAYKYFQGGGGGWQVYGKVKQNGGGGKGGYLSKNPVSGDNS